MQVIDFTSADRIMSEGHTSKGDQPKWKQSGNWYKADHMGYEALSEIIVSRLLTWSNADDFVVYQPVFIHYNDKVIPGCSSHDFMRKDEMLIPFERLHRAYEGRGLAQALTKFDSPADRIAYTVGFVERVTNLTGVGAYLTAILELDCLTLNEDRHTNNLAVLRNEETKEFRLCPIFDSPSNDDPLQPSTGLVNRPSGSGEVHQKKRNGSRNNCGNSADTEDLLIHILHDRTCLRPNGICGESTSGKHAQHRRHHKCYIQSTTNAYISESLLQLLDDGRFVLIHTGKSSFQLEPKRKARGLGSATQTPGLCMKNAPGRAEGRPSIKLFDAIILAFMEYRCN